LNLHFEKSISGCCSINLEKKITDYDASKVKVKCNNVPKPKHQKPKIRMYGDVAVKFHVSVTMAPHRGNCQLHALTFLSLASNVQENEHVWM
jgi:hypothetical protein